LHNNEKIDNHIFSVVLLNMEPPSFSSYLDFDNSGNFIVSEFGCPINAYLNIFDGLDVTIDQCESYRLMTQRQLDIYNAFRAEFKARFVVDRDGTTPDDFTILCFLQADKYDIKLAMKRLLGTIVWRKHIKLNDILQRPPASLAVFRQVRSCPFMGYDNYNRPIFVERMGEFIGALDTPIARSITHSNYLACCIYEMGKPIQKFREQAKLGRPLWKQVYIVDCQHATFVKAIASINLLKSFSKDVEVHFPEQAAAVYIINVPTVLSSVWRMASKILDPVLVSKIQLSNDVPTDQLLQIMSKEVLFKEYGGENMAPFPHVAAFLQGDSDENIN